MIPRDQPRLQAGPSRLFEDRRPAALLQRSRDLDPVDPARRHVGQRSAHRQCRRRSALPGVLRGAKAMSASVRIPSRFRRASRSTSPAAPATVKGKLGTLEAADLDRGRSVGGGRQGLGEAAQRVEAGPHELGRHPRQSANMVEGVCEGLREEPGDQRHRLSCGGAGQEPAAADGLQPRRDLSRSRKASRSSARSRPRSRSPASTSRRSVRSPRRFAPFARPSPTRARASSTRASTSSARKARRSNG